MPEFDNDSDRLEQFFRKATNEPQVPFSEDDWRKLEVRLDAADAARGANVEWPKNKIITATILAVLLLSAGGIWWGTQAQRAMEGKQADISLPKEKTELGTAAEAERKDTPGRLGDKPSSEMQSRTMREKELASIPEEKAESAVAQQSRPPQADEITLPSAKEKFPEGQRLKEDHLSKTESAVTQADPAVKAIEKEATGSTGKNADKDDGPINEIGEADRNSEKDDADTRFIVKPNEPTNTVTVVWLPAEKVRQELVISSLNFTERNKQKARIELPGAEEADETGGQTMVEEEHASEKKEDVAKPRLSLLLSFAPDFSGTSLNQYSPPGKAFAGMIHYHLKDRWSVSAGVVKNYKQYTGAGEDYTPPYGYWKYATNGIIPETIDGSCSILEFPVMLQYTVRQRPNNRWILGVGSSSYVMQTESYRYYFSEPNPGAKEGWDSKGSSRFMFNMLNLTIGYEHRLMPGLMAGVEPYLKLPLEEIGWSNLKLYSSGISITLRYTLIKKGPGIPVAFRSRGPD